MTRVERAARKEAVLKARRDAIAHALAQAQSGVRAAERADLRKRQLALGKSLTEYGWLTHSDEELINFFALVGKAISAMSPQSFAQWTRYIDCYTMERHEEHDAKAFLATLRAE